MLVSISLENKYKQDIFSNLYTKNKNWYTNIQWSMDTSKINHISMADTCMILIQHVSLSDNPNKVNKKTLFLCFDTI